MIYRILENLARWTTDWTGSTMAFILALLTILVWITTGPIFGFSDTWQLIINTSTTIVTFLMVFLLQRAHNKESLSMQIKLNELLASHHGASNRLLNIEELSEDDIRLIQDRFKLLKQSMDVDSDPLTAHTVEEIKL